MKKLLLPLVLLIVGCNPSSEDTSYSKYFSRCSLNDSPKGSENLLTQECDDLIDDLINEQNTNKVLACRSSHYCPLFLSFDAEIERIELYKTEEDIIDESAYLRWEETGRWETSSWDLNTVTWYGGAVNSELPYRSFNRETLELIIEQITVHPTFYGNRLSGAENKTYEWNCSCQVIKKGDLKNLITNTLKSIKQRKLERLLEEEEELESAKKRRKF